MSRRSSVGLGALVFVIGFFVGYYVVYLSIWRQVKGHGEESYPDVEGYT